MYVSFKNRTISLISKVFKTREKALDQFKAEKISFKIYRYSARSSSADHDFLVPLFLYGLAGGDGCGAGLLVIIAWLIIVFRLYNGSFLTCS